MTKTRAVFAIASAVPLVVTTSCANITGDQNGEWPTGETMTMIVGYSAGGTTDTMARELAKNLEEELNVKIQVLNQPGAGGQNAYTEIVDAEADGLTFGTLNYPTILTTMIDDSRDATYDLDDFQPVANHVDDPRIPIVHADSDIEDAQDLVDHAEENPDELRGATSGLSGGGHFSMLKLEEATNAEFSPVHFDEGQADAKAAFLGEHVEVYFASIGDGLEVVESGEGRAVGVMSAERSPLLPDVPTFAEQGIDIEESGRRGYALPAGVPEERVQILADAFENTITDEEHNEQMAELALQPDFMGTEEYATWLEEQMPDAEHYFELSKDDEE